MQKTQGGSSAGLMYLDKELTSESTQKVKAGRPKTKTDEGKSEIQLDRWRRNTDMPTKTNRGPEQILSPPH